MTKMLVDIYKGYMRHTCLKDINNNYTKYRNVWLKIKNGIKGE